RRRGGVAAERPGRPGGRPTGSRVGGTGRVGPRSGAKRATAPAGGRGTAISLMCSAAMRPVSRFFCCALSWTLTARLPVRGLRQVGESTSIVGVEKAAAARAPLPRPLPARRLPAPVALDTLPPLATQQRPIAMIDLYALTSPNVQKIYIMLEECGLPYKEHFVDVWKGEQYKPEFSKINPNNKIPAIVDHD